MIVKYSISSFKWP